MIKSNSYCLQFLRTKIEKKKTHTSVYRFRTKARLRFVFARIILDDYETQTLSYHNL